MKTIHPARRRLFAELLVWMIGLGLVAGLVFPPFVVLVGVPETLAYTPKFYTACLMAGLSVGGLNFWIACRLVRPRVKMLSDGMRSFRLDLEEDRGSGALYSRGPERFHVPVDSLDELGRAADSFNRLVDVLVRARRTEESVRDFSNTLAAQLDLAPLCRDALSVMLARTGAVGGALLVIRDGVPESVAAHGIVDPAGLPEHVDVQEAFEQLRARRVESPEGVILAGGPEVYPREMLLLPLEINGAPLGMLVLTSLQPFTAEIFRLLDFFRQSLKLALQNALSHERLGRIALLDPLTGCYNRRMGMERLEEEFSRALRSGTPLGLIMVDIDHFKSVNDTWGHLSGDRILVNVVQTIQEVLRDSDVLVRYGGEEFMILLPGSDLGQAGVVAERVRAAVASMEISGQGPERITVSLGVDAGTASHADSADTLLQRADEALYRAKSGGRDRVIVAGSVDREPTRRRLR